MRFAVRTVLALLLVPVVGCSNSPTDPDASAPVRNAAVDPTVAKVAETTERQVDVEVRSWEEIQSWVASQQGKVVVVDVWSTSCVPCLREFPHFVELSESYAGDAACASVNIDYYGGEDETPEDIKPRVLKFLTSKEASLHNFISSDADEEVTKQIKTASIPAVLVYDRDGKLHTTFNNDEQAYGPEGFSYAKDIAPLVQQLLSSTEP